MDWNALKIVMTVYATLFFVAGAAFAGILWLFWG